MSGAPSASFSAEQFARLKTLFGRFMELPAEGRAAALGQLDDDPAVIAELRQLLNHATATLDRAPLQAAMQRIATPAGSGDTLGAWTLCEQIGAGGMGKVFRAKRSDGHFHQQAAVKLLGGAPSATALRFLARERQILASLAHPNIARLLDGGSTAGGEPYLVMEYVEGLPLLEYCRRHAASIPTRLQLMIEICAAVAFAHQHLVVHCDLKPGNILVTASGRPMLLDFGISRLLDDADQLREVVTGQAEAGADPRLTQRAYTPRYASPEQRAGKRVGTATDVYSLGLLLAELLEAPWPEDQAPLLADLPAELAAIIAMATREEPTQRYLNVGDLADDLRRYLAHEVVRARRPTPAYLAGKWLRRYWVPVAVTAAFLILLGAFSWQMRIERDSAQAAEGAARAVKDYMVSVFQGADPELAGRRDLPVSHFLDTGRERLRDTLQEQPATRAELATILGGVYQSIGLRTKAVELFDEAIALAQTHGLSAALAEATYRKAYSLYDMENFADALPVAREALALHGAAAPASSAHLDSLRLLGLVLSYRGDLTEARAPLEEALAMARAYHGADSVEVALSRLALARSIGSSREAPAAVLEHAIAAGEIFARQLGAEHYRVADALEMRLLGLVQLGRSGEAVPYAEQLVARRRALYGEVSHPHSYALQVQASVLRRAGQHLDAIPVFGASLAIHDTLDGPDSVASQVPLSALALAFEEAGHHQEALRMLRRHLAIQQAHPQNAIEPMPVLRLSIARNLRLGGQAAEARAMLPAIESEFAADPEAVAGYAADLHLELAASAREAGDRAAAEAQLDAIAEADRSLEWHRERARLALANRDLALARAELDLALQQAQTDAGVDSPEYWLLRIDELRWLRAAGEHAAAATLLAEVRERLAPRIHPQGRYPRELQALAERG